MKKILKKENGVTLIALIVSVIVLLILAGVSISVAIGDHDKDIISKTYEAKEMAENDQNASDEFLQKLENEDSSSEEDDDSKHTVSFYNGNTLLATIKVENGMSVTYPDTATLPEKNSTSTESYEFNGEWAIDSAGTQKADLSSITSDMIVYAMFDATVLSTEYEVIFKDYDGTTLAEVTVNSGETAVYPNATPTRTGYTFSNWVTTSGGSTAATLTNITASQTVYASYTIKTYTVTFSYKNSSGTTITSTATVNYGSDVASSSIPSPVTYTSGSYTYTFSKWVTTSGGSTTATLTSITEDKTVYASYTSVYNDTVCFVAGTKVLTENGLLNIEDVQVGMKVYSYNEITKDVELKDVLNTFQNEAYKDMIRLYVNGELIESTSNHPYYEVNKGWIEAKELEIGDLLLDSNGKEIVVETVEFIENDGTKLMNVFNMEIEDNHNYFVGKNCVLVHNHCGGSN